MKFVNNKLDSHIEYAQFEGLIAAAKELEKAFKFKILSVTVNPSDTDREKVYGVSFAFDLSDDRIFNK